MAEVEEIPCSLKTQRIRKPNFSVAEEEMLQHEVGKHFEILNRNFSNTTTNHQMKAIWARITDKINALGVAISNGGHLGYRTALTDTILKGDHLRIISAKFG